ncbi:hypothetical protein KM792_10960 [Clostridium tyrobutyricum]|uniref:hypothetical protein n=1 Tax=Clostridium tyrobutyricum TaxID=1519 RepID=UPI0018AC5712|nr:hypothetical protein [Clostridium tyrobutyricum]MBV4450172.1 hypothetical protein [Clostridium tyrobutyricum]
MKEIKNVRGSAIQAVPIIVGKDTAYIHTNIHTVDVDKLDGSTYQEYEYDEVQYSKDEYIAYLNNQLLEVQQFIIDNQYNNLIGSV